MTMLSDLNRAMLRGEPYYAQVLDAYLDCAMWSTLDYYADDDETPEPLDAWFGVEDIGPKFITDSVNDIREFLDEVSEDVKGMCPEQLGRDFWLTREGHGAGFWDRGLGERGERLSDSATGFGNASDDLVAAILPASRDYANEIRATDT